MACKRQNIECLWVISIINAHCKLSILKLFSYIVLFAVFICLYNFAINPTSNFKNSAALTSGLALEPYFHNFYSFSINSRHANDTISNASQATGVMDSIPPNLAKYYQDNLGVLLKFSNNLHIFSDMFSQRHFNFGNLSDGKTSTMTTNPRDHPLTTTQLGKLKLGYEPFNRSLPHFISETDKDLFFLLHKNVKELLAVPQERLTGDISVLYMGNVNRDLNCGWRNNLTDYHNTRAASQTRKMTRYQLMEANLSDIIVPLLVPDGWSFQHFIDGVLPKLAQIAPFLSNVNIKIMLKWPRDKIIFEMLQHTGINDSRVIQYKDRVTLAGYQLNTCITPPLHPRLWSKMRELLGMGKHLQVLMQEASVILLTRAKSRNRGRNILNLQEVISYMLFRYNDTFVLFEGGYSLAQSKIIYGKAHLVLGVHGGAFYNINFSPVETVVAEYLPIDKSDPTLARFPSRIVWAMADMSRQRYYWLMERPLLGTNLQLNLTKLKPILDEIDSIQLGKH